jgi:hypothetical protein
METATSAFVLSLHETFAVGAMACLIAAGVALLIQNPQPRTAPAVQRLPEGAARAVAAD